MLIKNLNIKRDKAILKMHKKMVGDVLEITDKYDVKVFYDYHDNCLGYMSYNINNNAATINWIYAPNHGKKIMYRMEKIFKKNNIDEILLKVSIDPTEEINTVMKRINFYISLHYKVYDIVFRKKYGPLLLMRKNI